MINRIKNLFLIVISLFALTNCNSKKTEEAQGTTAQFCLPDSLMDQVKFDTVQMKPVYDELKVVGKISFDQDKVVRIYPLVSGNVVEVKVSLGSYVEKGQVLAVIRSSEMAGAENDQVSANANVAIAEKNFAAAADMYKSGILSEKEYTTAQKELDKAKSELNRTKTVLSIYGNGSNNYVVTSPISGYIVEKFITANMQIRSDNSTNIFTISDLSNVWALANVYESDISEIVSNEKVDITTISYPDKKFIGKIDKIYNSLDPDSKTMKVQIQLENKDFLLKPEMFISAIVNHKTDKTMLAIPSKAIIFDRNLYWILVYTDKCHIEARKIDVVTSNSQSSYVSSGVKVGEKVITNSQLLIYNAMNQ